MGARTDFVRAMLFGVVIGVAVTTAFFQLRGERGQRSAPAAGSSSPSSSSPSSSPSSPSSPAARAQELARLRARIAELERAAQPSDVDADHGQSPGMSTDDAWWAKLPPDPAWDGPREQKVIARLGRLGVTLAPEQVECKRRCCRLAIDDETYDEHADDITSSVGLDFEPGAGMGTAKAGSIYVVTKCWSTRPADQPLPDRAAERDALLAKAKPELDRCAQATSPAITLKVGLHVDLHGQISKVDSNARQLGQNAATCAETALLQAASFASAPMATYVPLTVVLGN